MSSIPSRSRRGWRSKLMLRCRREGCAVALLALRRQEGPPSARCADVPPGCLATLIRAPAWPSAPWMKARHPPAPVAEPGGPAPARQRGRMRLGGRVWSRIERNGCSPRGADLYSAQPETHVGPFVNEIALRLQHRLRAARDAGARPGHLGWRCQISRAIARTAGTKVADLAAWRPPSWRPSRATRLRE